MFASGLCFTILQILRALFQYCGFTECSCFGFFVVLVVCLYRFISLFVISLLLFLVDLMLLLDYMGIYGCYLSYDMEVRFGCYVFCGLQVPLEFTVSYVFMCCFIVVLLLLTGLCLVLAGAFTLNISVEVCLKLDLGVFWFLGLIVSIVFSPADFADCWVGII